MHHVAIPLSLYIHFPWCIQKCPYCDFNSHKASESTQSDLIQDNYIEALTKDIEFILPYIWGRKISSIFIGGGTPSLIQPEKLARLFTALRARLSLMPNAEITMEANPGSADEANFSAYRAIGVNRLSIGVQSFNASALQKLGRVHNPQQAFHAFEMAKKAGFEQINLDLMFGLPEQTLEQALYDLKQAIALNPTHLSHYQLTLEPNTYFYRHRPSLPEDELVESMQIEGQNLIRAAGYDQYEVSAYAKPNAKCKHNLNYWEFGDYIGIGAGAHGKITMMNEAKIYRTSLKKHPTEYLKLAGSIAGFDEFKTLAAAEIPFEFMLNVLRLKNGVHQDLWTERTFLDESVIRPQMALLANQGLLKGISNNQICSTDKGFLFLNQILKAFID